MPPKAKAMERQAANEAARAQKDAEERERAEAASWSVGAKDNKRAQAEEEKEAQRRQKLAEKAALEAQEAAELSTIVKTGKTKKKGKDDFDFLKASLANQPKTKAQKEAEAKKAADEARRKQEEEARAAKEARREAEEAEIRRLAAKGIVVGHADALMASPINNRLEEDDFVDSSGLDAALDTIHLAVGGGAAKGEDHPERRQKAAYKAFYESTLPLMKEEYPGLKLSQYKERIFEAWKTAPENPHNQVQTKLAADV